MRPLTFITTVDVDAESVWLQAGERGMAASPSVASQGAFGPRVGLQRLLDVLAARGVLATFFVPGWVAEHWPRQIEGIQAAGHEIGLHGYLHEDPSTFVSIDEEEMILVRGREAVARLTGIEPLGYRPPGYVYTQNTVALLARHGFSYGSAMHDDDAAYIHSGEFGQVAEIPVLWHLTDDLYGWGQDVRLTPSQVEEHWSTELLELSRYNDRIFVPTVHPEQIGHPGRLAMFDRILALATEQGVQFRRCVDVAS